MDNEPDQPTQAKCHNCGVFLDPQTQTIPERILRVLKQFDFDACLEIKFDKDEWIVRLATPGVTMFGRGETIPDACQRLIVTMDVWKNS